MLLYYIVIFVYAPYLGGDGSVRLTRPVVLRYLHVHLNHLDAA